MDKEILKAIIGVLERHEEAIKQLAESIDLKERSNVQGIIKQILEDGN